MRKFTSGEWKAVKKFRWHVEYQTDDGLTVQIGDWLTEDVAHLIASAPDLLAALREALEFQNDDTDFLCDPDSELCPDRRCADHGCMVARVNRWRAVVAKAEGDS